MSEAEPTPPAPKPRLVRSRVDRVLAGVCGGLGRHLGVDPVLVRIAAIVLVFAGGAGLVLYVIGWIAMPEAAAGEENGSEPIPAQPIERREGGIVLGLLLVVLGGVFLLDELWPDFLAWKYVWPIALIAVGLAVLARSRR